MIHHIIITICCILFFNISAMQNQQRHQDHNHIHILMQDLVKNADKNRIIIFPMKTNNVEDKKSRRQQSEEVLSDSVLNGIRVCLDLFHRAAGKTFLVVDNKANNYEEDPAHFQGSLCKQTNAEMHIKNVRLDSTACNEASFIVYNMPYYKQNEGSFNWAYGEHLNDLLRDKKAPCLVFIDEAIYNTQEDVKDEIYRRFYGKKKVFQYDKISQGLIKYEPGFLGGISFPMVVMCAALASIGLYYMMPSGLAIALDTSF